MRNLVYITLFFSTVLYAQEEDVRKRMQMIDTAIEYAQIKRYDHARKTVQDVLSMEIPDAERVILLYDLATLLLEAGSFQQSEQLFIQIQTDYVIPQPIQKEFELNYAFASLGRIKQALDVTQQNLVVKDDLSLFQNRIDQIEKKFQKSGNSSLLALLLHVKQEMVTADIIKSIQNTSPKQFFSFFLRDLQTQKKLLMSYQSYSNHLDLYVEAIGIPLLERLKVFYLVLATMNLEEKKFMVTVLDKELLQVQTSVQKKSLDLCIEHINLLQMLIQASISDYPVLFLLQERVKNNTPSLSEMTMFALQEKIKGLKNIKTIQSKYIFELLENFSKRLSISKNAQEDVLYYEQFRTKEVPLFGLLFMKQDEALTVFQKVWEDEKKSYANDTQKAVTEEIQLLENLYKQFKKKDTPSLRLQIQLSCMDITYLLGQKDWDLEKTASFGAKFEDLAIQYDVSSKNENNLDMQSNNDLIDSSIQFLTRSDALIDPKQMSEISSEIDVQIQNAKKLKEQNLPIDAYIQFHMNLKALFLKIAEQKHEEQTAQNNKQQPFSLENAVQTLLEVDKEDKTLLQKPQETMQRSARPW